MICQLFIQNILKSCATLRLKIMENSGIQLNIKLL